MNKEYIPEVGDLLPEGPIYTIPGYENAYKYFNGYKWMPMKMTFSTDTWSSSSPIFKPEFYFKQKIYSLLFDESLNTNQKRIAWKKTKTRVFNCYKK